MITNLIFLKFIGPAAAPRTPVSLMAFTLQARDAGQGVDMVWRRRSNHRHETVHVAAGVDLVARSGGLEAD